jgi:allantoinase
MPELIIRGGTLVTPDGLLRADVAIGDGKIQAIGPELPGGVEEIDARGLHVFPAVIDVHLHFNEPGRPEWEGAATGSRALAAGGGAVFFDMPLNSTPCCVNAREIDRKRAALEAASITDFGLWGGLVPGSVPEMAEMADRGVVGFKAFMCDSGLPEFPRADDATLYDGLREAARLGLPVAVHAESEELTRGFAQRLPEASRTGLPRASEASRGLRDFLDSRPVVAELEAIQRALLFAGETHASLHIVHISTGRGVALVAEARAKGVDVSAETCAHYLNFTDEDVERLGAIAKCAPPLRDSMDVLELWRELLEGHVDIVASDHSPTEPARKAGDFVSAWGGIAGVQSTLPVLLDAGYHARGLALERIAELTAATPARRFRIARKGTLAQGHDADLVIVDPEQTFTLREADLQQRHKSSPYVGQTFRGTIRRTLRRGETIFADGQIAARDGGRFVRPFDSLRSLRASL